MSFKHLKYNYRESASKLHKLVGEVLRTHRNLRGFRHLQEYPVPHTNLHIDWYIIDTKLAIEIHGEQHFMPVRFGGITKEEAEVKFAEQQRRDIKKKNLCLGLGWKFLEFAYNEPLDEKYIGDKIISAIIS